jgi:ribokinase
MRALVFGSLNIDYVYRVPHFVQRGETLASDSLQRFSGGKGLNQAVALSRAGVETWMAGAVGEDGTFLLEELRSAGVDTRYVEHTPVPTGHAIIQNTPDGDNCILLYGGANRSITPEQAAAVIGDFAPGDLLLVQNEISSLLPVMHRGKEHGLHVALNPSPMETTAIRAVLPYADTLLLNRIEAVQLLEEEASPEELLRLLRERFGCSEIVLTLGGEGALLLREAQILRQAAFPVKAVDTTGAGDTFTGFFLAALLQGEDAAFALRAAAAAAALAVTRKGASPSIPDREEVLAFLKRQG